MRTSIIPSDNIVIVNGRAATVDLSQLVVASVRAVQWHGDHGEVEYVIGGSAHLASLGTFQSYIDQAQAIFAVEDAPPPPPTKNDLKALAADKRYRVETGGMLFGGMPVSTDRTSQNMIDGASKLFDEDPTISSVDWALSPDTFITLTKAQVKQLGVAVGRHVQACFGAQRQISALIDAGTITTQEEIETWADWPANS